MADQSETLSERELEILRLLATGAPNKEIARNLVISPNTVKVHLRNIFSKIGVSSRTEATLYAIQIGLIRPVQAQSLLDGEEPQLLEPVSDPIQPNGLQSQLAVDTIDLSDTPGEHGTENRKVPNRFRVVIKQYRYQLLGLLLLVAVSLTVLLTWALPPRSSNPTSVQNVPGINQDENLNSRWLIKKALPSPRKGMAAVEYENGFLIIAGESSQGIDASTLRYSPEQDTWEVLAEKPTAVADIQAVVLGEKVYVPGGRLAGGGVSDVLEVYDPRQNKWESKKPLPIPSSGYAAVSFEGRLYLFGGTNGTDYFSEVFIYDPELDRWDQGESMPTARALMGITASAGKIYVIGGFNGDSALSDNEVYYPSRAAAGEQAWEKLAPLPGSRYAMGVTGLAGFIYVVGGKSDAEWKGTLPNLLYVTAKDQWNLSETSPIPIGYHMGLISSGSFLYVLGGETPEGLSASHQAYQALFTITMPILREDSP